MGQFVMSFRGLNMHVNLGSGVLPPGLQHRVVAINASQGYQSPVWGDIPAHYCFAECSEGVQKMFLDSGLQPLAPPVPLFSMQGCRVRLANAAGRQADIRLAGVPHLTRYLSDMTLKEGISNDVDVPEWAACFVDINSGTVTSGAFPQGGIHTTWSAETVGDPVLEITRGNELLYIQIPSAPPLESLGNGLPGGMVMRNGTTGTTGTYDKQNDFVLYFLANAGGVPQPAQLSEMFPIAPPTPEFFGLIDMTTSCSNSQYP